MVRHYRSEKFTATFALVLSLCSNSIAQVDTTYIHKTNTPFGTLDIRIAKSPSRYYYLQENKTFSFRESAPGVKTNSFLDMTSWDSKAYTQGNLREKNGSADYFVLNYRLLFPSNYRAGYTQGYPLIVMLHGAGETGNCWDNDCHHDDRGYNPNVNDPPAPTASNHKLLNNDHNLLHGGKIHLDARNLAGSKLPNDSTLSSRSFPGFVLFPQNLSGWNSASTQDAIRLVRLIAKKYNVDENRIYIHGLSNGGIGVYEAIKRAPWLFAAALPMSAPGDANVISQGQLPNITHIPLWTFQGGKDNAPSPGRTEGYVKALRDAGAVVRYSLYSNLGHGVWNTAYKEADFFKWMLSKSKTDIHLFGGSSAICLTNGQGVRMELANGFRAYQWQKNGVTISGATSSSYVATTTGTYRARFSRKVNPSSADWNTWSKEITVTQQSPQQARIEQKGTVKLKDLNGFNSVKLSSVAEAEHYYWYKDGVAINLTGSVDDTVRHATISSGTGNGKYTLITKTADFCPSPASQPKYVFFSDSAPVNIAAPTNLTGKMASAASVKLNWTDASSNEGGFEVWRRKVVGTSAYTPWEMRTITAANIVTFTDPGVEPSSTYHYKIRAVSNTGRSNYTPSATNAYLIIKTSGDTVIPSTPQTLTASTVAINTVKLSWKASTDNSGIRQYVIYYSGKSVATGGPSTTYTLSNLTLNKSYSFTVKAEDMDQNLSTASNVATAHTFVEGLYYSHSTGAWQNIDAINWTAQPEFSGHVPNVTLAPRTQEDYFNFKFDGYLYITTGGTYQFKTNSSDGSRVEVNNTVVVNNDGLHGVKTITGPSTSLTSGAKRIVIKYFEYDGDHKLIVSYKGPDTGNTWKTIPSSALRSGTPPSGTTMLAMAENEVEVVDDPEAAPLIASIYPNPAGQSDINLQVETTSDEPVQVRMVDFTGEEVYSEVFYSDDLIQGSKISPVHTLRDGLYNIMVTQGDKTIMKRIMIKNY